MQAEKVPDGVYKNRRLMHACTTMVGFPVHLQTKDGAVWEGLFNSFSSEFTVCLDLAIQLNSKSNSKEVDLNSKDCLYAALKRGTQAEKKALFQLNDIARISAIGIDLNYAVSEEVAKLPTDADISGYDPSKPGEQKQLESWQDDGDSVSPTMVSLDEINSNANKSDNQNTNVVWDAEDMFRYNERVHKLTTTYDEKLTDYTVPLPKHRETKDWKKKQERAEAIAKEIEGNTKSQQRLAKEDEGDEEEKFSAVIRPAPQAPPVVHRPIQNRINSGNQNGTHRGFQGRPRFKDERSRMDSLKNFSKNLTLAPSSKQSPNHDFGQVQNHLQPASNSQNQLKPPQPHQPTSHQQAQQKQHQHQQPSPQNQPVPIQQTQHQQAHQQQPSQSQPGPPQQSQHQQPHQQTATHSQQGSVQQPQHQQTQQQKRSIQQVSTTQIQTTPSQTPITISNSPLTTATTSSNPNTSTISERSDTSSVASSQAKDHQSELARKSKLNPHAKEFVYKPRSPANRSANIVSTGGTPAIDPANPNPMSQTPHTPYYQPVTMFPVGISPHQQLHHAAQFMPNHAHFQNQIHYMSPVPPHFAQQTPQRYIRGNFQNYHHNNVRADYAQPPMMVPNSTGQPFVPPPSGAPHPMNAYASQQPMIYSGPPQSMYPVVQDGWQFLSLP